MKQLLIILLCVFILSSSCFAWEESAYNITTNTTNFDNNLSSTDINVQTALETLDELSTSSVSDTAYAASWNGVTTIAPSKNSVYDKIESLAGGHDAVTITCPDANVTAGQAITFADTGPIVITEAADTITFTVTEVDPTVDTAAEILAIIDNTALDFGTGVLTATEFAGPITGNVTGNCSGSSGSCTGNSATATLASTLTITDNENTAENNALIFTSGGDLDGGNLGLECDGDAYYTPSTGVITATGFAGALTGNITGNCSGSSGSCTGNAATVTTNANLTGEVTSVGNAATIADSVTVTGWVLGTSSATQITSPTLITDLIDTTGSADMDYGSADVTDHTFTSDGGTVILDGMVNSSAMTVSEIVITDASKNLVSAAVATYPSLTELTYVKGLTSAAQTQITAKGAHAGQVWTGTHDFGGATLELANGTADVALAAAGQVNINTTDEQIGIHSAADGEISGECALSLLYHLSVAFDPDAICDGAVDRVFLMTVGDDFPEGLTIVEWKLSFEADPTTEADIDLKYADTFIGVANAAVIDVCDTTTGASTEDTNANINGGAAVANGKVLYLEFGTAYTETTHQMIFEMWFYGEED